MTKANMTAWRKAQRTIIKLRNTLLKEENTNWERLDLLENAENNLTSLISRRGLMNEQHEMHKMAEYSAWHYKRGVEHGRREMRVEMLKALEAMSKEAKAELERETNEQAN